MKFPLFSSFVQRLAVREWLAIFTGMLLLALCLGWQNGLGRLDQTLYDEFVSASSRPARDDIIIVAIDDRSLAALGRWPWPRNLHAQLIEQLNRAHPRMIGLDVILSEPERAPDSSSPSGDRALENALRQSGRVVLPVVTASAGTDFVAVQPTAEFVGAAHALGHINLGLDADGVVRSVFLHEGQNGVWWPHFAVALAQGKPGTSPAQPVGDKASAAHQDGWQRIDRMYIPFAGGNGHFKTVSYLSVLRGEVPAQFFTGKYVLIGATAVGMTDSYPTSASGEAGAMAGIEINANVLAGLLDHRSIDFAAPWQTMLFSVLPVCIALFAYFLLTPRTSLLILGSLVLVTLGASYVVLRQGFWLPPSAALATLVISYPLWSWRRLEAAIGYLGQEFIRLDHEPHLLPEPDAQQQEPIEDLLEQRINAMKNAARRVRDLRQFVSDSLDSLPDATLVTTTDGYVLLANQHAVDYFTSVGMPAINGALLPYLLSGLSTPQALDPAQGVAFNWWDLLDLRHAAALENGLSVRDAQERDLLIKSAPCRSGTNTLTSWIVSLADISAIRAIERSRDETMRFLSHDMRAPQASILALLELQKDPESALPLPELFARIEKASRKTLGLADNFVQLARAESQEYRLEEIDFQDMLMDAVDEMWTLAKNKRITFDVPQPDAEYLVRVDRTLMTRVLTNLFSNAINYSPENTRISCSLSYQETLAGQQVVCTISDQGYGIAAADQIKLFRRFQHADAPEQPRHDGIGLGLVFVKTVIQRHGGQISFASKVGEGTTFTVALPAT
jgi:CHASE2 domain-containing sensor protein/signal transduction histidine kinase